MKYTATLHTQSPRAADWREVFGALTVPLADPRPMWAELPGFASPQLVYLLDLHQLTPGQFNTLALNIARRFDFSPLYVAANLFKIGCPILAADVTVVTIET